MSCHCATEGCCKQPVEWKEWGLLVLGALLVIAGACLPVSFLIKFILFVAAYLCCGLEVLLTSFHNLRRGEVFDENFLMTLATLGAFAIGQYPEGVCVMLFYQIGEKLQHYATGSSRQKITSLLDLRPSFARVVDAKGEEKADPQQVQVGQIIRVRPGERIALDGTVCQGNSQLDVSSLTGESRPQVVGPGTAVLAGTINLEGVLDVKVTRNYQNSAVAQILELAEHAASKKSNTEKFITRFARIYTPVVVLLAATVAIIPPLCGGSWHTWIYRALVFLVISCPCALVLSVPLGFFGGIGGAARHGILIKGSSFLERLTLLETVCFDKTGTLTQGVFEVLRICPANGHSQEELLQLAAYAEGHSNHPIAKAIRKRLNLPLQNTSSVREVAGEGVETTYQQHSLLAGNERLLTRFNIPVSSVQGTVVHVAYQGQYIGYIELGDRLKATTINTLVQLKKWMKQIVLVSGDNLSAVSITARETGIHTFYGNLLPAGKMHVLEELLAKQQAPHCTAFVGDGMNDAPVLKRADVGIAMGASGTDVAMEAADVVLMGDEPQQLISAIEIACYTLRIIRQNIWLALGIKILVLILGILGLANMWMAVFSDVGVSLLAVANSLRTLHYKNS